MAWGAEQGGEQWLRGPLQEKKALLCICVCVSTSVCYDVLTSKKTFLARETLPLPELDNTWRHNGPRGHTWVMQTNHSEPRLLSGPRTQKATFLCLAHPRASCQATRGHPGSPQTTRIGQTG